VVERDPAGKFVAGVSGNPNGRPLGRKAHLTNLKHELEIAIREHVRADKIKFIVNKMINRAINGDVSAAKLILDKVLSNANDGDEAPNQGGGIVIRIENASVAAITAKKSTPPPIDGDFTEVK
jgi:hypothetical protein